MTSKARQIYSQSGHWPQTLREISSELDEILRRILLPKLIHPKWSETKDQTDSWILTLKWFVVCSHQCEKRGWAVKAREHVPQSLEHGWLSLLRLVQQVLSPAAALERVSKRGKEGIGGEREKTKKARMARWLGFSQLKQACVVFPQDLGKKLQNGNREMARKQLQCKLSCFFTVATGNGVSQSLI